VPENPSPTVQKVLAAFPEAGIEAREFRGQWSLEVPRERVLDVLRRLRDDPELDFAFLNDVTCTDHPEEEPRFRAVWVLTSFSRKERIRVRSGCPEDDPVVPSATPLWAGANWLEREAYDMFGVKFEGHPDLRRILMPEEFDAFPLRKEFPMEGERSDREWARWVLDRARRPEGNAP
jgi:NADH-quinone oxidoreductase subunit C